MLKNFTKRNIKVSCRANKIKSNPNPIEKLQMNKPMISTKSNFKIIWKDGQLMKKSKKMINI